MAHRRTKEIRAMDAAARKKKRRGRGDALMHARVVAAMGGAPPNPGKIRALRKNIARLYTIQAQEGASAAAPAAPAAPEPKEPEPARAPAKEAPDEPDEEVEEDRA